MRAVPRTIAFLMGGMRTGGGVAWVGTTCSSYSDPASGLGYCEDVWRRGLAGEAM